MYLWDLIIHLISDKHDCTCSLIFLFFCLTQCFPNCGAVDLCGPVGGPRDPLESVHHVCCNSSFVIFYILIHLIIFLLPF